MEKQFVQDLVSKVLPSYDVLDMLGEGSFGAVYRIKDSLKERAVKILQLNASASIQNGAVSSGGTKIERDFRHIIDSYEKIACDEIVTVYDFYKVDIGEDKNQAIAYAVIVMELYPFNLIDFMMDHFNRNGRLLDIETVKTIMEKLAKMLGNLYTLRGFLFEDLKPENLLVKYYGDDLRIVVGDIGGLKSLRSVSATGSQVTLSYCAAEVIRGRQKPDLHSIMYSYGLICHQILEGHLPYEDSGATERIDLLRSDGVPFHRPDTPDILKSIIERCLAFQPDERYVNFEELFETISGNVPVQNKSFSAQTIDLDSFLKSEAPASALQQRTALPPVVPGQGFRPGMAPGQSFRPGINQLAGLRPGGTFSIPTEQKRMSVTINTQNESHEINTIDIEIDNLTIRNGDVHKLQNKSFKVKSDIVVENGGMLIIENAKLFFEEKIGILSTGTIRAKGSFFAALDSKKGWGNIALHPLDTRLNVIDGCKFRFGKGKSWEMLKTGLRLSNYPLHNDYTYGGGLFVAAANDKVFSLANCSFYKCSAHEGGAIFGLKAHPAVSACTFEMCSASLAGGGIYCFEANLTLKNCRWHTCTALKEGGGMYCRTSTPLLEKCVFENCTTKFLYGGGIFCFNSSPSIKDCRFNRCAASRDGGAIFSDDKSKPTILFPSFANCKPNDTNFNIHGKR